MGRPRPNILLVMTDQQRADSVGYARSDGTDTPFLDSLARRGVIFDNAYSASTVCVPARSSILTGLFDHRLPRGPDNRALKAGYWTVAHALSAVGYETALFGKMHFSPLDARHGFDVVRSCEHLTAAAGYAREDEDDYRRWLRSRGIDDPRFKVPGVFPLATHLHPTHWITAQAKQFLKRRDAARPFFAIVSYTSPHTPLNPPAEYAKLYDPEAQMLPRSGVAANLDLPPIFRAAFDAPPGDMFSPELVSKQSEESVKSKLAFIRALIRQIDDSVAELLDAVSLDDTVVFFTSDHGDYGGHRGLLGKVPWLPFEDLAKVPFFAVGAGVRGGRRVSELVQSCDLALTSLELAGLEPPAPGFDTEALTSVLAGAPAAPDRSVFCAFSMGWPMIRRKEFKFLWHFTGQEVLYDLATDPGETRNLATEQPSLVRELRDELYVKIMQPMLDLWVDPAAPPLP
jgi:choline-sulfatase